jgi:acetyl esterase/lipase
MDSIKQGRTIQHFGLLLVFALIILAVASCATMGLPQIQTNTTPDTSSPRLTSTYHKISLANNVSYGPKADEILDRCVPLEAKTLRPGVILIHGGAWSGGDKTHYTNECQDLAHLGFVAVTINYRLTSEGNQWPDQIGDAQLAVRWMRANADTLNLDPSRVCALGDSAGAHLALLLDELTTIHPSDVASYYPNVSPQVQCAVDQFGPADLAKLYTQGLPFVKNAITSLMDGKTPAQAPALYRDASPVDRITAKTGQVLITQGTQDTTVLPDQSTELQQALQEADIPVHYISYTGGHEYFGSSSPGTINLEIYQWLISVEHP